MGKGVEGQWYIDLSVAGTQIQAEPTTLTKFEIISNIHQHLPSINFCYRDANGDYKDMFKFKDGDPISVSVGVPGQHIYEGLNFVMVGHPRGDPSSPEGITIQGVLNNIAWLRKVIDTHTLGNASDVFSKLAKMAGLKVKTDATSDKMAWLPNRTSLAEYARFIADRAWASDTSCFVTAVTDTGVALLRDIDKVIQEGSKKLISGFYEPGSVNCLRFEVVSKTHVANSSRGYGATLMTTKNDGAVVELNKVAMRALSGALPFASLFQSAIGDLGNRVLQIPMMPGNTHDKWAEAQHQNMRIKSLYAFDIDVLTDSASGLTLLDKVTFKPMDRKTGEPIEELTGDYMVTAITKTIAGMRYYEKIKITSQGPNG